MTYDDAMRGIYTKAGTFLFEGQPVANGEAWFWAGAILLAMSVLVGHILFSRPNWHPATQVVAVCIVITTGFFLIGVPHFYMENVFDPCTKASTVHLPNGDLSIYTCAKRGEAEGLYQQSVFKALQAP